MDQLVFLCSAAVNLLISLQSYLALSFKIEHSHILWSNQAYTKDAFGTFPHQKKITKIFVVAMLVVARADDKWPSTEKQINKLWHIMKYIAPVEKNELQLQCDNVIPSNSKLSNDHSMMFFIMFEITKTSKI